jgi:uncharacterized membrane protein
MNFAELKTKAKAQIKGNIGILFLITLIIAVLSGVATWLIGLIPVVGAILAPWVVAPAFALSTIRIYLSLTAGMKPTAGDAFCGFDDYWAAIKVTFLVGLFTFLWSLLFIIPGIVKSYAYSMSTYILAENKGKSARECINESKAMTNGYKGELFLLGLSFIGWLLLCAVTFGIAGIWVYPYMQATYTNAYQLLKSRVEAPAADAFIAE